MSELNLKKMKVVELREELQKRGLETKGTKPVLLKRLEEAVLSEGNTVADESTLDESGLEESVSGDTGPDDSMSKDAQETEVEAEAATEQPTEEPTEQPAEEAAVQELEEQEDAQQELQEEEQEPQDEAQPEQDAPEDEADQEGDEEEGDPEDEQMPLDEEFQVMDSVGDDADAPEADQQQDEDEEKRGEKRHHDERERSRDRERRRYHRDHRSRSRSRSGDRDRRQRSHSRTDRDRHHSERSRSPWERRNRHRTATPDRRPAEPEENEDWIASTSVQLDRFNCDLNIRVNDDGVKCCPITVEGFAFMWSGVRANYGVTKGKVAFEVKIVETLNVDHLPPEETSRHVVRVGFSADSCSLQLGEEDLSYGYGGTAKSSVNNKFEDYGEKFGQGDVITAYLDLDSEEPEISYSKNGEDQGKCFSIDKEKLGEKALFPHILSKNCEFEVNFGQREEPHFALKEGFVFMNDVAEEDRVRGTLPPAKKEDCEILMMCGLPGCGKTVWADKHNAENPDKRYCVLGTNSIIDKMKVMGLPRKKNYSGRWDVLIDKSTKCLNRMLEIASKKKRNYILDQTNVYPSAQRRKMRPFEGFQRKAIVIVPTDEEFKRRCEQRKKEKSTDCDSA